MKILLSLLLLFTLKLSVAQDTSSAWLNTIDTSTFKLYYNKISIPKEFYSIIGIDSRREIVSANKSYRKGCIGPLPGHRLNWLAKDDKDHWIISVSHGGVYSGTKYIYIDHEKGKRNVNGFYFPGKDRHNLTLGATTLKIKRKEFQRMDPVFFAEGK